MPSGASPGLRSGFIAAVVLLAGCAGAAAQVDPLVQPRGIPIAGLPGVPSITTGVDANTWMGIPPPTQPFDPIRPAGVVRTTEPVEYYVRLYTPGANGAVGGWVMRASTVRGLTPEQLRDRFALPFLPTNITNVLLPSGTCLLNGIAGPITGSFPANPPAIPSPGPWGNGGAQQTRVIGVDLSGNCSATAYVSQNAYINRRAIGANALWYAPVVASGNPAAVGAYLDHLPAPAEYSGLYDAYNTLDVLDDGTATALRPALRELTGETHAAAVWVALTDADRFARTIVGQARATFDSPDIAVPHAGAVTSYAPTPPSSGSAGAVASGRWWAAGGGVFGKTDGNQDRSGHRLHGGQGTVGYDWKSPGWLVGTAMSLATADVTVDGAANSTSIDSVRAAGYAATRFAGLTLGGTVIGSWERFESARSLPTFGQTASASSDGWSVAVAAEASRAILVGGVRIEPTIGLDFVELSRPGFTETGAGDLSLVAERETAARLASRLGATVTTSIAVGGAVLRPWLRAFWAHDYLDRNGALTAGFLGATAPGTFTVLSADIGRDTAIVGAGARLEISPTAAMLVAYDGDLGRHGGVHAIMAGGTVRW
jgi:uncharacterized protein with beta-barrel porin domain